MSKFYRFLMIVLFVTLLATACAPNPAAVVSTTAPAESRADLSGIKSYLLDKGEALGERSLALQEASNRYYALAVSAAFDYAALWAAQPAEVSAALQDAKTAWLAASPLYEQMEGIVAGVPSLSQYDVVLDAGASGAEDPENAAPFDLELPDGRVLAKPGNLFGILESALWGTEPEYTRTEVEPDLDGNGAVDFGEALPDANVLKGAADLFQQFVTEMGAASQAWEPTESDSFTALVVMIPTMNEYFNSWKNSRFVAGDQFTQRDFVAISRLSDIQDILGSLQVVYQGVEPLVGTVSTDQADQIETSLADLKSFVAGVHSEESSGKRFSPEDADILGAEAQDRATALAGQIAQIAARLNIQIEE